MPEYRVKPGGMHQRALNSRKKMQIVGGGFGNGKTALVCIKAINLAKYYPGSNGIIAMASYAQLNDTIREEFYKWVPSSSVQRWPTLADNTLIFKNGTKVNFRYLQQKGKQTADGQTSSNLLSATYDWAVVDQLENPLITYKDFLDLLGRLRGSTPYKGNDPTMPLTGPRWLICACNPAFNWVFHKLIKPYMHWKQTGELHPDLIVDPQTKELLIEIFEAPTYENAHNLEPDFIRTLEAAYTGQFRDRYLGGQWGAFEGLVYENFDAGIHMQHTEGDMLRLLYKAKQSGMRYQGIEGFDYGIASPSAYLCGFVDERGVPYFVDGFYEKGLDVLEIGHRIGRIQGKLEPFVDFGQILADPSIFKRNTYNGVGKGATSISKMLSEYCDLTMRPGQNDIMNGIAKVGAYLAVRDMPNMIANNYSGPAIYFASHLTFVADEMGSYFWKQNGQHERIDEPMDRNDHSLDALKYALSYLPPASEILYNVVMNRKEYQHGYGHRN